jgi:hypothetical protein
VEGPKQSPVRTLSTQSSKHGHGCIIVFVGEWMKAEVRCRRDRPGNTTFLYLPDGQWYLRASFLLKATFAPHPYRIVSEPGGRRRVTEVQISACGVTGLRYNGDSVTHQSPRSGERREDAKGNIYSNPGERRLEESDANQIGKSLLRMFIG